MLSLSFNGLDFNPVKHVDFDFYRSSWAAAEPFNHLVIDDFLALDVAEEVASEFPDFDNDAWRLYNNAIEVKKLLNHWDKFGPSTYRLFNYLNSPAFVSRLEVLTDCRLYPDPGLNGGGLHTHGRGGKLNPHLDYSIHPKLGLERRLNLLVYLSPGWQEAWGGLLGLWSQRADLKGPGELQKTIAPLFNRAVLFDTTQGSWHGLPDPIDCPQGKTRNSVAVYYLCEPRIEAEPRGKALFAPYKEQAQDADVLALIKRRSDVNLAASVYGDKPTPR